MADNRRALLREKLKAAVDTAVPVVPITGDEPTERPAAWLRLADRDEIERDASGDPVTFHQHFEILVFTEAPEHTEEAADAEASATLDRVVVAVEEYAWGGSETCDSGETVTAFGARCPRESIWTDPETGRATTWIPGFIEYTNR